ncbi:MAG: response regulator [Candidatus Colwellbacteria bacterium]|nr:response regulator [Candidatus Colwellbacteria bacterium]
MGVAELLIKTAFGPKEFIEKVQEVLAREGQAGGGRAGQASAGQSLGTILIIEDDPFLWSLIRSKLIKEGFNVTVAQDGEKGLKEAREAKPDLILLDLILPDFDGFSVLEQLKKDEATASIPVIILSNLGQQEDVARGTALGAKDYLIKAHHAPQEIVERVKKVLGK